MPPARRDPDDESDPEDADFDDAASDEVTLKSKSNAKGKAKREPSVDDEEEEVIAPKSKKARASNGQASAQGGGEVEKNDEGDPYIKLSDYRRVTVRTFKGKVLVDLREMYKDKNSGELKPGAKGISLTLEQWDVLRGSLGTIDKLVKSVSKSK